MLYSFIERKDNKTYKKDYDDYKIATNTAMRGTFRNENNSDYWCKIYQKDLDVEIFFSEDLRYLEKLYLDKLDYGEDFAREWVRDEICQYGKYKMPIYLEYMEVVYGEK